MTELFFEVYNCYFQVIQSLIGKHGPISEKELNFRIQNDCLKKASSIFFLSLRKTDGDFLKSRMVFFIQICQRISTCL